MNSIFRCAQPVIGMVHLQALPGAPGFCGNLQQVLAAARHDLIALQDGGVDGLMFENFNDVPFYPDRVPPETIAAFAAVLAQLRHEITLPFGVNVLRNDGLAAVAIAAATGAHFIRVNVLSGATVTDQGILQSQAHAVVRKKTQLAPAVKIFADVQVKHSATLVNRPIGEEACELLQRAGADAIIASGSMTGHAVQLQELQDIRTAAPHAKIILGSGVTAENLSDYSRLANAFIVGTAFKCDGNVTAAVDEERVKKFMRKIQEFK